jgi:transposase InsO family protein
MNQRKEFVLKAIHTGNFRQLCQEYGISTKTGYKWRERFYQYGYEGMAELSRKPVSHAQELSEAAICQIIRLKQAHPSWGARKLRDIYQRLHSQVPSESSFKRVLERAGLVEKRRLRRRAEGGRNFSGRKASAPNEIWTVDFKGWWHRANGQRCEPLTVRDEFSRYVLELRSLADARTETVRACFEGLFGRHGVPQAIRSDNGAPFASRAGVLGLSRLSAWWVALGIDLERGRPGCPQDNGAHERLHLDVERELRGQEQQASFDQWRHTYNHERPHEALAMRRPAEVYQSSARKFEGTPEDLTYPRMETRRVRATGEIRHAGNSIFISTALSGWSVGLEPSEEDKFSVHFGRLLLGQYDEATLSFRRSDEITQERVNDSPPKPPLRRPQNGPQAHDLNRELEFGRPAQVGATPFGDDRVCSL